MSERPIKDVIEYLVRTTEALSPEDTAKQLAVEVRDSGASARDVSLAFSALVTGLNQHLRNLEHPDGLVRCSFCQKSQREVEKIVQGPVAAICDECVEICVRTIRERPKILEKLSSFWRSPK